MQYSNGSPLRDNETCSDCARPLLCRIKHACQACHETPMSEILARNAEIEIAYYRGLMKENGIVETSSANGVILLSGTKEQWLEFFHDIEAVSDANR